MSLRETIAALLLLAALVPSSVARAQSSEDERARMLYVEGDRHYNEGRYELAVQAFQQSYNLSGRPLLLFNLANAYERLGRYADALQSLRGYQPHAPPNEQAQIGARIASLEQRANELGQVPGGGSTVDDALLIPGIILTGAGVVLGVSGIAFGVLALDAHAEAQALCTVTADGATLCEDTARDAIDRETLFALLADIGIGVGAAAVAAGIVLVILGATSGGAYAETATARIVPYAAPRAGGGEVGAIVVF